VADQVVIKEFLATLGYRVDESAQRRFLDAITSMSNAVIGLGAGIAGAAGAVTAAVANMASSAAQMQYLSLTVNDTVSNIDALTFAWQKLGLAPQQTMGVLQNLANMMRTQPGLAGLWQQYAGAGSITQQLQHFGERFAQMTQGQQFVIRQQFEKILGPDFFNAILTRGGQVGGGVNEFNFARRLFHFDPDEFAKQSVAFERAWQSFQLRLNDIMGHQGLPILQRMTAALQGMTNWLDSHSDQIISTLDKIGQHISSAFGGAVDMIGKVVGWFERLPADQQQIIAAVAAIMAAFVFPETSKIAVLIGLLSQLFEDYKRFQDTGKSFLPWGEIESGLGKVLELLGKLADATNGWITPLHALEAYFVGKFVVSFVSGFAAIARSAVAAGATIAATSSGFAAGLSGLLGGVLRGAGVAARFLGPLAGIAGGIYAGATIGQGEMAGPGQDEAGDPRRRPGFRAAPPGARLGPTNPELLDHGGPSIWERLGHVLSYLNPISVAEGAELPGNVKQLSATMAKLNDTLEGMSQDGAGGFGSWATGLGSGIVSNLFGGGGGGAQGPAKGIDSPEAIEAVKYFMSKGWTMPQAIGIVSNLVQESGLSSTVVNSTGHAGVAQWDAERQRTFRLMHGKPITAAPLHEQYDFVDEELRTSQAKAGFGLHQALSSEQAAMAFDRLYERSEGTSVGARVANARALGADPRLQSASFQAGNTVTQTNNVTINTSADPNAVGRAWDEYNRRHWADIQRNQQGAFQ
jgi:hypothetical protein